MMKHFDSDEEMLIKQNFEKLKEKDNHIPLTHFIKHTFLNLPVSHSNLKKFLIEYHQTHKIETKIESLTLSNYFTLIYILTKASKNEEDSYFYQKKTFDIIYDIFKGKIGSCQENYYDWEIVKMIFDMVVEIFIFRHLNRDEVINACDSDKFIDFLKCSIMDPNNMKKNNTEDMFTKGIERSLLKDFLDKLPSLESFLSSHLRLQLMGIEFDISIMSSVPLFQQITGNLSTELYLFYCLSNPHIYYRKYGFKLFDSKKDGFCILSAINSFIGFGGPIGIFFIHFDKEENKEYILGGYINSNINESFADKYCGDDLSMIFSLYPVMKNYFVMDGENKVAYLCPRALPNNNRKPGIGFGEYHDKFRLWIDGKDTSHASYFLKFDHIFEDGSPFEDPQQFLNVKFKLIIKN